jgi:hypothetical protein
MKLNWLVDGVCDYAHNKGQVEITVKKPNTNLWFRDQITFLANKGEYEVGNKIEIEITNYTKKTLTESGAKK